MTAPQGPIKLEGPTHISVLFRVENGAVTKIRSFSMDCPLDGGGLPFHWLTNAKLAESVALLSGYATRPDGQRLHDGAMHALAQHAGTEAESALETLALSGPSVETRKRAVFWLGGSRGKRGFDVASRVMREDPNEKVREHAIFAVSRSREAAAVPAIIRAAKEDKVAHVRGQALFWLAERAAREAIGPIRASIDSDPETEVKKKAVMALSRIANGEGIPALIQVAQKNQNPVVRKQAMFWLGQSKDPRAVRYFEEVLAK